MDRRSFCNSNKGGCGAEIVWSKMFGKAHPFNLDGTSHFDTCPNAEKFRGGLRTLGDRDTFYRQRWRERFYGGGGLGHLDLSALSECEVPRGAALKLGEALQYIGGPMHYANWTPASIANLCVKGFRDASNKVVVIVVDKVIAWRVREYLGKKELGACKIAGFFLIY